MNLKVDAKQTIMEKIQEKKTHKRPDEIQDNPVPTVDGSVPIVSIESRILTIRGRQVMVDRDLAELYQVDTKRLNEQVKRNSERFPAKFRFQLDDQEKTELVANCDRFKTLRHSSVNPFVFTEQGVAMLSAVLKSERAVHTSIRIIEAFVSMRSFLMNHASIFQRIESMEMIHKGS